MRFEPVSHDPRGQQPGATSTVPPLASPNGRHPVADPPATAPAIRDLPLTAIVASPLQRTMETAAYLNAGRGLTIQQDEDLIEVNFGPYAGQCWDELDVRGGEWTRFVRDPRYAPKGVESFERVQRRAVRAVERWRVAPNVSSPSSRLKSAHVMMLSSFITISRETSMTAYAPLSLP